MSTARFRPGSEADSPIPPAESLPGQVAMTTSSSATSEDRYQRAAFWIALVFCAGVLVVAVIIWLRHTGEPWQTDMMKEHYAVMVGLPWAAAASFVIVTFFRQVAGRIRLKGLGFEIEGAGGPVLLWVACFMAISTAIRMLWDLKP